MPQRRRAAPGVTFDTAARLALKLPGVEDTTSYRTRSLKVKGKLFARLKDDETLVIKMDITSRDLLLRAEPELFFLTDHYHAYPYVLLRLPAVSVARLEELLEDAWRLSAPPRLLAQRPVKP